MTATKLHIAAAAALLLSLATAQAEGLKPIQAQSLDLGEVNGIAYYTVEHDGFHVVATLEHVMPALKGDTSEVPLRVQAVLASGQSLVLSTPGWTNAPPVSLTIKRHGDELVVLRNPQRQPAMD
jgi:hypothetical protein